VPESWIHEPLGGANHAASRTVIPDHRPDCRRAQCLAGGGLVGRHCPNPFDRLPGAGGAFLHRLWVPAATRLKPGNSRHLALSEEGTAPLVPPPWVLFPFRTHS